jgi:hypothetical protein
MVGFQDGAVPVGGHIVMPGQLFCQSELKKKVAARPS